MLDWNCPDEKQPKSSRKSKRINDRFDQERLKKQDSWNMTSEKIVATQKTFQFIRQEKGRIKLCFIYLISIQNKKQIKETNSFLTELQGWWTIFTIHIVIRRKRGWNCKKNVQHKNWDLLRMCSPPVRYAPPVTEHMPLHSKLSCKNKACASGSANNMRPLSWGHKRRRSKIWYRKLKLSRGTVRRWTHKVCTRRSGHECTITRKTKLFWSYLIYGCRQISWAHRGLNMSLQNSGELCMKHWIFWCTDVNAGRPSESRKFRWMHKSLNMKAWKCGKISKIWTGTHKKFVFECIKVWPG